MRRAAPPLLKALSLSTCASRELVAGFTAAMSAEGVQGAVGVCFSIAPALAAQFSKKDEASVGRTI